jgi:hypothetical protein
MSISPSAARSPEFDAPTYANPYSADIFLYNELDRETAHPCPNRFSALSRINFQHRLNIHRLSTVLLPTARALSVGCGGVL